MAGVADSDEAGYLVHPVNAKSTAQTARFRRLTPGFHVDSSLCKNKKKSATEFRIIFFAIELVKVMVLVSSNRANALNWH